MDLLKELDEKMMFDKKEVRIIGTFENPWFVARDICDIIEIKGHNKVGDTSSQKKLKLNKFTV